MEISQKIVAFSEYMNFKLKFFSIKSHLWHRVKRNKFYFIVTKTFTIIKVCKEIPYSIAYLDCKISASFKDIVAFCWVVITLCKCHIGDLSVSEELWYWARYVNLCLLLQHPIFLFRFLWLYFFCVEKPSIVYEAQMFLWSAAI